MSKENLVNAILANNSNISKKDAEDAIKMVTTGIQDALKSGNDVNLVGFGKFEVKDVPARTGRNPATGEQIQIAARKSVKFKVGQTLKKSV